MLLDLNAKALRPNKHISPPTYQYLAHQPTKHDYNKARPWGYYKILPLGFKFLYNPPESRNYHGISILSHA